LPPDIAACSLILARPKMPTTGLLQAFPGFRWASDGTVKSLTPELPLLRSASLDGLFREGIG
jgi:hypothetical protein